MHRPLRRFGVPHQCPLEVGSKLPLPLYADMQLSITMPHHHGRSPLFSSLKQALSGSFSGSENESGSTSFNADINVGGGGGDSSGSGGSGGGCGDGGECSSNSGSGVVVALSGSLPVGAPQHIYATLADMIVGCGGKVIIDTSGAALRPALEAAPFAWKPNREELEAFLGT